jgi:isocitrate dehydrogenase
LVHAASVLGVADGVGDEPEVPVLAGDGVGPEVIAAARRVVDAAVEAAYGQDRTIRWNEVLAGHDAHEAHGDYLPDATIEAFERCKVGLKGPLKTPVGEGFRSLNVRLRQALDLYASVRPTRWIPGVPSPLRQPERVDVVVFRENTEDVYAGMELAAHSEDAAKACAFFREQYGWEIPEDAGLGLKPISERRTKRLVRAAVRWALAEGRDSVTLVHKGNIMKETEGAFRRWGYEVVEEEFAEEAVRWEETDDGDPGDRLLVQDVIADAMFQAALLRPRDHDVIATTNLNGDYISDAFGAKVGGIGVSPGANIDFDRQIALFEPVHGTAPDLAGQGVANPTASILSAGMMLRWIGWDAPADRIDAAIAQVVDDRVLTGDLAGDVEGAERVGTDAYTDAVIDRL